MITVIIVVRPIKSLAKGKLSGIRSGIDNWYSGSDSTGSTCEEYNEVFLKLERCV